MNCFTGPKEFDCSNKDYIKSKQEFDYYVDQDDVEFESNFDYEDLIRSDVIGELRSGFGF